MPDIPEEAVERGPLERRLLVECYLYLMWQERPGHKPPQLAEIADDLLDKLGALYLTEEEKRGLLEGGHVESCPEYGVAGSGCICEDSARQKLEESLEGE